MILTSAVLCLATALGVCSVSRVVVAALAAKTQVLGDRKRIDTVGVIFFRPADCAPTVEAVGSPGWRSSGCCR